jgi:hypothetical protein
MKRKPFFAKRAWWGWMLATASSVGLAVIKVPGPAGILLGVAALGAAIASYSVQETQREIAIQGTEKAAVLATAVTLEKSTAATGTPPKRGGS